MDIKRSKKFFLTIFLFLIWGCSDKHKITNPVAPDGHDPWVIKRGNRYYYCYSHHGAIWVNSSKSLVDAVQFEGKMVWRPKKDKSYSNELWAPELHYINNKWYIYVAADDGENINHRMYALVSQTNNPLGKFEVAGKVADQTNKWAIDGTVMRYKNELYCIWSGWKGDENVRQNLYIAKMSDPTTISSKRVMISTPRYDWEKVGNPLINEGPEILKNPAGNVFIIYSASGSWTNSYCLGQLKLVGDDPLDKDSWKKKAKPVFEGTEQVFSPGHASFTKSPDGNENWIVYHTAKHKGAGWNRDVNIKKFTWDDEGNPVFGKPIPKVVKFAAPSR